MLLTLAFFYPVHSFAWLRTDSCTRTFSDHIENVVILGTRTPMSTSPETMPRLTRLRLRLWIVQSLPIRKFRCGLFEQPCEYDVVFNIGESASSLLYSSAKLRAQSRPVEDALIALDWHKRRWTIRVANRGSDTRCDFQRRGMCEKTG